MKKEDLIGLRTKEVKELLDKKGIRYEEDIKKKLTFKEPSGNIVEIKETDTGELVLYESNRKVLVILMILAVLIVGLAITFGYRRVTEQIIEITGGIGAPELEAEEDWGKERLVKVVKDAKSSKQISFYEYCVKEEKSKEECKWDKTYTKNAQVGKTGIWEVIFRAVDIEGKRGKEASKVVKVDNNTPDVNSFKAIEIKETSIKVKTEAKDNHSGIDKYMYSLDGVAYSEGNKEYTFNNLEAGKEYRIYVKVIDKVGNESIVRLNVRTGEKPDEWDTPKLSLDKLPSVFELGKEYDLPSDYDFGNDTGEVVCTVDGKEYKNTSSIGAGKHKIICTATSSHGKVTVVEKEIRVTLPIGEDIIKDGWIKLNLYYPEESYDWEWRYGLEENNQDEEYEETGWQPYTGPILIKIEDIPKIYIRYKLDEETWIIPPTGTVLVDIQPVNNRVACGGVTSVNIQYDADALTKEYRINGGNWQPYTGPFTVNGNTIVEARATKNEDVYNNIGEFQFIKQLTGYDKVTITSDRCSLPAPSPTPTPSPSPTSGSTPSPTGGTTPSPTGGGGTAPGPTGGGGTTPSGPVAPTINLNGITARMYQGDNRSLPSYYSYGSHGRGSVVCEDQNGNVVTNTKYLGVGTYTVTCTLTAADGATVTARKTFDIIPFTQDPAIDLVKLPSTIKEGDNYQLPSNYTYGTHGSGYVRCDDGTDPITNTRNLPVGRYVITCEVVAADGANAIVSKNLNVTYSSMPYIDLDNVPTTINLGDFYSLPSNYSYGSVTTGTYICTVDGTFMNDTSSLGLGNHYIECNLTNTINQTATATKVINVVTRPTPAAPGSILAGPQITSTPSSGTLASSVDITITPQDPASIIYYRIGLTGTWQVYNGVFPVTSNATIYAKYIRQSDGKQSQISSYRVTNIQQPGLPYVAITTNPDVTDPTVIASQTDVEIIGQNYTTLEYSFDGIVYMPYTGIFTVNQSCTVYAKATDQYGQTAIDVLTIVLTTPPNMPTPQKDPLTLNISADPDKDTITDIVNETEITINYDARATIKLYRIGAQGQWQTYTGPFKVYDNTTVYAYEEDSDGDSATAQLEIDFLTTGIPDPVIYTNPSDFTRAQQVKVTIEYHENASIKMYRINGGEWQEYTGEFYVTEVCTVEAYQEDKLGNKSDIVSVYIGNIIPTPVYTSIDEGDYYLIRLNYPSTSEEEAREYKWKTDGVWKKYDEHGILIIKQEEKDKYNFNVNGIKVKDVDGNLITIPMTHVYILDVPYSELSENLFMRWDNSKPSAPTINLSVEEPTKEVEVTISYSKVLLEKYYRIIEADGTDSGWLKYTGPIKITKNNTLIYARGKNRIEIDSEISAKKITNIDEIDPTLTIKGDLTTPRQKVTLSVTGNDNLMLYMVKWAKGSKNVDYFNEGKTNQGDSIKNGGTVTIEENGIYTFYAVDSVGNEIVQEIEVTNVDRDAPDIVISVLTKTYGTEAEIDIDYGDSVTKEYSIGNNTNYKPYTGMFKITSYDVASLANSDGTLTIYARGKDALGNEREVSEIVYVLDLGMPARPTINAANSYPTLTKNGFIVENTITVNYDNTYSPMTNEISLDNGRTWNIYTGNEHLRSGTIGARSRKASGLTVSSSKNISMPSDAIPEQTYDNSSTTYATLGANVGKTFKIDEEVQGRKVRIYQQSGKSYTVSFYNASNTLLNTVTATTVLASIQIPSGATKAIIKAGSAAINISHIALEEEKYDITGESILQILQDYEFENGYYTFRVNGQVYTVHMYNYNSDQTITANKTFGDVNDVATASTNAQNMVIVKVNGNLTINSGVTVGPYYNSYGGPKGFTIYVTGKLTNNGTIDNSHGAKAAGQNVYLWKNASGTYETVPATGGAGGSSSGKGEGYAGAVTTGRQTAGGSGGSTGKGSAGTSYSGGSGGGGSGSAATNGGAGGKGGYMAGGGAGNPGGSGSSNGAKNGSNGTGGLLVIYSNEYKNNGIIKAVGAKGGSGYNVGGSSGGGSINIFTNQTTGINALGIVTDTRYNQILGTTNAAGGAKVNCNSSGCSSPPHDAAAASTGRVNIGKIINGTYVDLKTAINNDKKAYEDTLKIYGNSILSILNDNDLGTGYHTFVVNGQTYTVHLYNYNGDQTFTSNKTFGDANDVATASTNANNMVIVKVNGNLTINSGVIVQPYYNSYGGPKGFTIFVTGKLTNNGTIDNSHGAKAAGQNVYLWKNASGTYETVPATGGAGGSSSGKGEGYAGAVTTGRQTAGGSGGSTGKGSAGTSYSGGSGGGGSGSAATNGGAGGKGGYMAGGGAGNPGGSGSSNGAQNGSNGTGGLLTIYAKIYTNNGTVSAHGAKGGSGYSVGGSSGGGSINIFYKTKTANGTANVAGGGKVNCNSSGCSSPPHDAAAARAGRVTYTSIDIVAAAKISVETTYPALSNGGFIAPTYKVTIDYEDNLTDKLYSIDGTNFSEYTGPFTVAEGTTVYAKAKEADGTQKNTVSYKVNPISDMVEANARDNNLETVYTQPANTTKMFTVKGLIDRQIRIYLSTVPGSNSKVTIYDKNGNSIGEQELTNGITFVEISSKASKIGISSGSSALGIKEINVRAEKNITTKESPVISTNSTNWTTEKTVTISYIDGYTNEYSLDLGTTWSSYTESITLSSNNVVIARAKDANGKIVASSSYTVTKIDNVEPEVTIDIDSKIGLGSNNILPTSYNIDTTLSGGTVECKDGNNVVTNTSELELGNHNITCTVTTGSGKKATVSKTINVVEEYEITFEDLDDLVANETRVILAGDKLGELPVIEKSGFIGWYKEQEYLEEISENTIPSSSTTYYAKYEEIPSGGE